MGRIKPTQDSWPAAAFLGDLGWFGQSLELTDLNSELGRHFLLT